MANLLFWCSVFHQLPAAKKTCKTQQTLFCQSFRNEKNCLHLESPKIISSVLNWDLRAFGDDCPKVSLLIISLVNGDSFCGNFIKTTFFLRTKSSVNQGLGVFSFGITQTFSSVLSWDLRAFDDDCPKVSLLSLKFYQEKCEEFLHNPPWMGNVFDGLLTLHGN